MSADPPDDPASGEPFELVTIDPANPPLSPAVTFTGLAGDREYRFRVTARSSAGESLPSRSSNAVVAGSALAEAKRLEWQVSLAEFIRTKQQRLSIPLPERGTLNYTDDGCSGPTWADVEKSFNRACQRHDFGYRNFGHPYLGHGALWRHVTAKTRTDDQLGADAFDSCQEIHDPIISAGILWIRCSRAAEFVRKAMNTSYASDAFFGKNTCPYAGSPPNELVWNALNMRTRIAAYSCNIAYYGGTGLAEEKQWERRVPYA